VGAVDPRFTIRIMEVKMSARRATPPPIAPPMTAMFVPAAAGLCAVVCRFAGWDAAVVPAIIVVGKMLLCGEIALVNVLFLL